jgi:ketosteroid isomerase-like protein
MTTRAPTASAGAIHRGVVEQLFEAVDRCEWEALPRFFCPEIVYERPGYPPLIGLAQVLHFYREVRVIASGVHRLHDILAVRDRAVCCGEFRGSRRDGTPVEVRFADAYAFSNGKIRTRCTYFFQPAV